MGITYGSVCSGIEAATTAWHPLGWSPRWFAEIEPFPSAVLAHHWPQVPNLGDFTAIRDKVASGEVEAPDLLVGGTPCQAFSVAGLRQSLDDKRGQLTLEFVRLADALDSARYLRGKRPVTVVWENVPGVLNTPDNAFGCFLAGLVREDDPLEPPGGRWTNAGYVRGPGRAVAWRVLDAQYFGVAQRRRRVFVVASAREGFCPDKVLFEFDGVRRDSPPRREAGQGFAPVAGLRTGERSHWEGGPHPSLNQSNNIGGVGMSNQELFSQRGAYLAPVVMDHGQGGAEIRAGQSPTLTCNHEAPIGSLPVCCTGDVFHTLRAEGFDASEDGTGRGVGAIAIGFNARQDPDSWENRTGPLDTDGTTQAIAFPSKDYGADATDGIAPTMRSMGHAESHANGGGQLAVAVAMQVRRITPTECERLQGFPDGHTRIPWPVKRDLGLVQCSKQVVRATVRTPSGMHFVATNHVAHVLGGGCPRAGMPTGRGYDLCHSVCGQEYHAEVNALHLSGKKSCGSTLYVEGHTYVCDECRHAAEEVGIVEIVIGPPPTDDCPDGPRYKAIGNSMAVPVMRWIGTRIARQLGES